MGAWDFYKGFGESFEDWGGSQGNYGLGNLEKDSFNTSFKGLDMTGFPGGTGVAGGGQGTTGGKPGGFVPGMQGQLPPQMLLMLLRALMPNLFQGR